MDEKVKELEAAKHHIERILKEYKGNPFGLDWTINELALLTLLFDREKRIQEWENAIKSVQKDNPDEVHCTCVPLLKVRIKELEQKILEVKKDLSLEIAHGLQAEARIKELEDGLDDARRSRTLSEAMIKLSKFIKK